jgi:hypothetical protein
LILIYRKVITLTISLLRSNPIRFGTQTASPGESSSDMPRSRETGEDTPSPTRYTLVNTPEGSSTSSDRTITEAPVSLQQNSQSHPPIHQVLQSGFQAIHPSYHQYTIPQHHPDINPDNPYPAAIPVAYWVPHNSLQTLGTLQDAFELNNIRVEAVPSEPPQYDEIFPQGRQQAPATDLFQAVKRHWKALTAFALTLTGLSSTTSYLVTKDVLSKENQTNCNQAGFPDRPIGTGGTQPFNPLPNLPLPTATPGNPSGNAGNAGGTSGIASSSGEDRNETGNLDDAIDSIGGAMNATGQAQSKEKPSKTRKHNDDA